ncbi:hypothetical protein DFQ29_006361 [Apophysomyces sp. BC1021]|nr:hypothetical protein DFQ29_006361 [Apophysomyces sp. BC1021]
MTSTSDTQQIDATTSEEQDERLQASERATDEIPAEQLAIDVTTETDDEEMGSAETDTLLVPSNGRRREHVPALGRSYSQDSVISTQSAPPPYELYPPARTVLGRMYNWLPAHCPTLPRFVLPAKIGRFRAIILCISFLALFLFSFLLFCSLYFAPAPLPPPTIADKTTDTYARFLTLNIFMRPPGIKNNWSDFKDDRLDYIIRYILPEYDVIAFQEAFGFATRRKDHLIRKAREMGFNHHVESPRQYPWDLAVDGGLLLLSRFPIVESGVIEYPRGAHSDWLARKGALHALVQLNATRAVHIYTTHAQASYTMGGDTSQQDIQIRLEQFSRLHEWMKQTAQSDDLPLLLMGDFNVDAARHGDNIPVTSPSKESSHEYKMMMDVLSGVKFDSSSAGDELTEKRTHADPYRSMSLVDVVYKNYGYHPVTFGDVIVNQEGDIEPAEIVLTDQDELMSVQSIDRILWAPQQSSTMNIENARVEKFLVQNNDQMDDQRQKDTPFTQVSDHYGLSCVLHLI